MPRLAIPASPPKQSSTASRDSRVHQPPSPTSPNIGIKCELVTLHNKPRCRESDIAPVLKLKS